ncbi:MAG TPA: hypothetical protein VHW24_19720, partial [Bryobacteraceae bacterium]|nr:hypothetical protein [Bryobacteraceae bacterium]
MMLKAAGLNGVLIAALAWGSPQTATPDFEAVSFKQVSMSDARQLPAAVLAGLPGDGFHIEGGP